MSHIRCIERRCACVITFFLLLCIACEYNSGDLLSVRPEEEPKTGCEAPLNVDVHVTQPSACNARDGEISLVPLNGAPPFVFRFGSLQNNDGNFDKIPPGRHTFFIADKNNCVDTVVVDINAFSSTLQVEYEITSVVSCEKPDGQLSITLTGGLPPYNKWLSGRETLTNEFKGLSVGSYLLRVEDKAACTFESIITITRVPSGVSWIADVEPLIKTRCAKAGCHGVGQGRDFSTYNGVKAYAGRIKDRVESRQMPLDGQLTEKEIATIVCWVDDGALEN